jgi:hypothetical protein
MPMPPQLAEWWRANPHRWKERRPRSARFPDEGSRSQQFAWFQRQFLKLADEASSPKERAGFLKLALSATLKGLAIGHSDDRLYPRKSDGQT